MKQKTKWIVGAGAAVVFAALQLTNPARTNPPVLPGHDLMATNPPPPQVAALLHGACYDCHSYQTQWPWYSHVAPVSWLIASDVKGGRRRLNFSEWPHAHPASAAHRWENVSEELGYNEMPPVQYRWMHPAARLTGAQRQQLIQWADQEAKRLKTSAATVK
ncbi:MAG: heme-binding domain-containing protein [Verrucomicrobiota bacterium]|nr:heme-binding domain-containing protein [Verrucomicrobiota bacterium]